MERTYALKLSELGDDEVDLDELTGTSDPPSCVSPTVFLILGYLLYCQRQDAVLIRTQPSLKFTCIPPKL